MGNWKITIEGVGPHHNGDNPKDADRLAAGLVRDLKAHGQTILNATFFTGQRDDYTDDVTLRHKLLDQSNAAK